MTCKSPKPISTIELRKRIKFFELKKGKNLAYRSLNLIAAKYGRPVFQTKELVIRTWVKTWISVYMFGKYSEVYKGLNILPSIHVSARKC